MSRRRDQDLDRQVENIALNNMVGREFDLMEFVLEKAIVRHQLVAKDSATRCSGVV